MLSGGRARRGVGARERGGSAHPVGESGRVERVDENAGLGRHELGRASDTRRDDRALRGHRLEQGLAERLDRGRLAEDGRFGEIARHLIVRDAAGDLDIGSPFQFRTERPVADKDQFALAQARERVREAHDVLALDQASDADEDRAVL